MFASVWSRLRRGLMVLSVATASLIGSGSTHAQSPDLTWRAIRRQNELLRAVDARMTSLENLTVFRDRLINHYVRPVPWNQPPPLQPAAVPGVPGQPIPGLPDRIVLSPR